MRVAAGPRLRFGTGQTPQAGQRGQRAPQERGAERRKAKGTLASWARTSLVAAPRLAAGEQNSRQKSICFDGVSLLPVNWFVLIKSLQQGSELLVCLLCSQEPDIEVSFAPTCFAPKIHVVPGVIEDIHAGTGSGCVSCPRSGCRGTHLKEN